MNIGILKLAARSCVILCLATRVVAIEPTITILPESSPAWPAGTDFDGFVSSSSNPLAPFNGQSVHFRGWGTDGSQEQRLSAYLVYRVKIEFPEQVDLRSVTVSGAAFNGPDNVIRVLDSSMQEIAIQPTSGGNSHSVSTLVVNARGKVFYVDEFDTSSDWRYRDLIQLDFAVIDPSAPIITILPESSPAWPAGTDFNGFVSSSSNPVAPFNGQSVHFRGWRTGGSQEQRLGAYLVYRAKIEFPQEIQLRSVTVSGAAFNGPGNAIRVLDSTLQEIAVQPTFGGNSHAANALVVNARGKVFYMDEFDTSSDWRYRDLIRLTWDRCTSSSCSTTVPATADPWLAGMPDGSFDNIGTPDPPDVASASSPVLAPIAVEAGAIITWSSTGAVGHPEEVSGADGAPSMCSRFIGANNGISDATMPICALVGVFLGPGRPDRYAAPAALDFSGSTDYLVLSPALQQAFFMGDGLTSRGVQQRIIAPAGATRLFLGTMDGWGWADNVGAFEVSIDVAGHAVELINDGSFETGGLSHWEALVNGQPLLPWLVRQGAAISEIAPQTTASLTS